MLALAAAGLALAGPLLVEKIEALREWRVATSAQPRINKPPQLEFDLSNSRVPRSRILSGGPPKDGIPALSRGRFVRSSRAQFLQPDDRVIGVAVGDEAKAYPLRILNYHEAVNDVVGGKPLAVTYCPLCDSAAVLDRRTEDGVLEFGISGLLYNSNVLLYDRSGRGNESLWSQLMARSIAGPRGEQSLRTLPLELTSWADWSARHPRTTVLSPETGHRRDYSRSPYQRYFQSPGLMFQVTPLDKQQRLPHKTPVLGVWSGKAARAFPIDSFKSLNEATRIDQELAGRQFSLLYDPAYRSLRVHRADPGVEWMYAFWFAWYAFHPDTELYKQPVPD